MYIVFAFGFYIGQREPFTLTTPLHDTIVVREVRGKKEERKKSGKKSKLFWRFHSVSCHTEYKIIR